MDISKLKRSELLDIARELQIEIPRGVRKPYLISEIEKRKAEIKDVWNDILGKNPREVEEHECHEARDKGELQAQGAREADKSKEKEEQATLQAAEREGQELFNRKELATRQLPLGREVSSPNPISNGVGMGYFQMSELIQPFNTEDDISLYLVNFEKVKT